MFAIPYKKKQQLFCKEIYRDYKEFYENFGNTTIHRRLHLLLFSGNYKQMSARRRFALRPTEMTCEHSSVGCSSASHATCFGHLHLPPEQICQQSCDHQSGKLKEATILFSLPLWWSIHKGRTTARSGRCRGPW